MRTAIQNKITQICRSGTFPKVSYDSSSKQATKSTTNFLVPAVVVNEVAGSPSKSVRHGARDSKYSISNWQFEARLKFTSEVDTYLFLTEELKPVAFIFDNTRVSIESIGVPVAHPPRQGSHNGTEMVITFVINTRR